MGATNVHFWSCLYASLSMKRYFCLTLSPVSAIIRIIVNERGVVLELREIASITAGYPFRGKIPEMPSSRVIAVQMKDVSTEAGIRWSGCTPTELTIKRESDLLCAGDILVAARGSRHYAVGIDEGLNSVGKQAVAAPHFFVVRLNLPEILPEFVVWLLNQPPCQRYFEQNAEGTLTKSIRRSVLETAPIVAPTLAEQNTIVAMANTLRQEQRLVQQLVQNGERMMGSIASELFSRKEIK